MSIYDKVYKECCKLGEGKHFDFLCYDKYKTKVNYIPQVIKNKDAINSLIVLLYNSKLPRIMWTKGGSIKKHNIHHAAGAYDIKEVYTKKISLKELK